MTKLGKKLALFGALLLGSTSLSLTARAGEHDGQQLYPLLSYRTGPYASSGIPQWAGIRDYITYVNETQGGVDGVKIFVQECETAYTLERAFECYERYKNGYDGATVSIFVGTSSGFDAAGSDKFRADKNSLHHARRRSRRCGRRLCLPLPVPAAVRLLDRGLNRRRLCRQASRRL